MKTLNLIFIVTLFSFANHAFAATAAQTNETRVLQKSTLDSKAHSQLSSGNPDKVDQLSETDIHGTLDEQVVSAFVKDDCARVFNLIPEDQYQKTGGRTLAIVAACNPPGKDPQKMFTRARELSPADESILLLQARYESQKEIVTADDLWRELLERTKDPQVKAMAALYLTGDSATADALLLQRKTQVSGFVQVGGIYETNPSLISTSDKAGADSQAGMGATSAGLVKVAKTGPNGSLGLDYYFSQTAYTRSHESDLFAHELGVPLLIEAGRDASITIRPYINQTLLGQKGYLSDLGASLMRSDAFNGLTETVTASYYYEHYFQAEDQPQQGSHMKVEYGLHRRSNGLLDFDVVLFIDHSSAGEDNSFVNQNIPYSNFTYGGVIALSTKGTVSFGLNTVLTYRADDNESSYVDSTAAVAHKTRIDLTTQLQPYAQVEFGKNRAWEVTLAYQYSKVKSNIGETDYLDRNSTDHAVTLSLRRFFEN